MISLLFLFRKSVSEKRRKSPPFRVGDSCFSGFSLNPRRVSEITIISQKDKLTNHFINQKNISLIMGLLYFEEKRLDSADKVQLILSYFLQSIILGSGIFSILRKQWVNAFFMLGILVLTFTPAIVRRNYRVFLPVEFDCIVIVFIFLAVFMGEIQSYYHKFWWWDTVLHTSSGFLIGLAGFLLVYLLNSEKRVHRSMSPLFISIFAFAFALSLGALWEIFEFSLDQFFQLNTQKGGLVDTMWDLIVDTIGAMVITVLGYFYLKRGKFLIFDRMIHRFVDRNPRLFKKRSNQ